MINTNNYQKGLFNGDTGIWQTDATENQFVFRRADDSVKRFQYLDNKQIDTAFAITIHKSQDSEFRSVLIVLPDRLSPVMTR